jgi:membrane-bound ClpP family serine protease
MTPLRALATVALLAMAATPVPQGPPTAPPPAKAVPAWRQATSLAVVTVRGEFDATLRASIERRIAAAASAGARAAVLDIDTPGGDLYATLELCIWIKERAPIPVWAWIHPKAYSAGTIIALACRGIVVSPGAAFGDAAPIAALPGLGLQALPVAERAKLEAPVLSEVVDSARRNGYDETVVRAFVSAPDEVWLLERKDSGARMFIGREEYVAAFGVDPVTTRRAGSAQRDAVPEGGVLSVFTDRAMRPGNDEGPTDERTRDLAVEDAQVRPPVRARLTPEESAGWSVIAQVDGAEELLVVQAPEAASFGLSLGTVADDQALAAFFGASTVTRWDEHFGDALVRFLTSWPVRLFLVAVLLGGFALEMLAPGISWPGAVGAGALLLLIGAPALAGVSTWWPLLAVLAGIGLVLLEVLVIPGVGVIGAIGAACVVVGLVGSFLSAPLTTPQGRDDLVMGIGVVAGGGILAGGLSWLVLRAVPASPIGRRAVLAAASGTPLAPPASTAPLPAVGAVGRALTPLRPVGKAEINGHVHDVQAVEGMLEAGTRVRVLRSSGYAIEVEESR